MRIACFLYLLLAAGNSYATGWSADHERCMISSADPWCEFRATGETHHFAGLASYYNDVNFYFAGKDVFQPLEHGDAFVLENGTWLAVAARFEVLLAPGTNPGLRLSGRKGALEYLKTQVEPERLQLVKKSDLHAVAPELDQVRYAHLWAPLSWLAKVVEYSLVTIHAHAVNHWGLAIVVFSILLKLALFPVNNVVAGLQDEVSRVRSLLEPRIADIKANYDGEEAHNRIMAVHRTLGVTPFYSLKPLLGVLVQVPIWIAVFNALGEMPQLAGQSFLWIDDLAYPDVIAVIPFNIPLFGETVHLLPFVMFAVTYLSVLTFRNDLWSNRERARQRRNLCWMALAFLLLLYPFPAAMVLYWTLNNLLHFFAQLLIRT